QILWWHVGGRHQVAGLHGLWIGDPAREIATIIGDHRCTKSAPVAKMRKVRPDVADRVRAADRMATVATVIEEELLAMGSDRVPRRCHGLFSFREPALEILRLMRDHLEGHPCVLRSAELGTLPAPCTRLARAHGNGGGPAR